MITNQRAREKLHEKEKKQNKISVSDISKTLICLICWISEELHDFTAASKSGSFYFIFWRALKSAEVFRQTCVGCLRLQGLQARRISGQQRQEREKVGGGRTEDEEGNSERQFLWFGSSCGSMYSQHFCLQTETFLFALQTRFLNLWPSDLHCIWHYNQVWDRSSQLGAAGLSHLSSSPMTQGLPCPSLTEHSKRDSRRKPPSLLVQKKAQSLHELK